MSNEKEGKLMEISVTLPEETLSILNLPKNASPETIKETIEHLDERPVLSVDSQAGRILIGFDSEADEPQAYTTLIPKGSTEEIDLAFVGVPHEGEGDLRMALFGDPFSEEPTDIARLRRDDVLDGVEKDDAPARGWQPQGRSAAGDGIPVTLELSPTVLNTLGLPKDAVPSAARERIEHLADEPFLGMDTEAGRVNVGVDRDADYPQAYTTLIPKDRQTEIDLALVDVPRERDGEVRLLLFDDPYREDPTHYVVMARENVVEAMRAIGDYEEEPWRAAVNASVEAVNWEYGEAAARIGAVIGTVPTYQLDAYLEPEKRTAEAYGRISFNAPLSVQELDGREAEAWLAEREADLRRIVPDEGILDHAVSGHPENIGEFLDNLANAMKESAGHAFGAAAAATMAKEEGRSAAAPAMAKDERSAAEAEAASKPTERAPKKAKQKAAFSR